MKQDGRKALKIIRRCVADGRYRLLKHFAERMDERGMFWPDVLAVVDDPTHVRDGGPEQWGRPKWILAGTAGDGLAIELVCILDTDERGQVTLFVTIY